jgi:hypothetical protein
VIAHEPARLIGNAQAHHDPWAGTHRFQRVNEFGIVEIVTHPIEAGRLPDGSPDVYFRGFYCWNSEVGSKTLGIASFYLRAVCMNRNLWGVENFEEITIRHSKFAAQRFAHEAAPALTNFANSSPAPFIAGIKAARERIVARSDGDRETFLRKRGLSKSETAKIIDTVLNEEGRPRESLFDFVQGLTATPAPKPIRTRASILKGGPRNCWNALPKTSAAPPFCGGAASCRNRYRIGRSVVADRPGAVAPLRAGPAARRADQHDPQWSQP